MILQYIETHNITITILSWLYGYLGWVIYNIYLLKKAHKIFDLNQDGYSWNEIKRYGKKNSLGILLSFLLVIVGVTSMPALWEWFAGDKEFHTVAYFLAGFMAIGLQKLMEKAEKL